MSVAAAIRRMLDAGFTVDQALIAAEAFEAEMKPAKSAGAIRTQRYRENQRHKASQSVTVTDGDNVPDKEGFPQTPFQEIIPQDPPIVPPSRRFADPAVILQTVTDPLTARNFADHCAQRKPRLTEQSAAGVVRVLRDVEAAGGNATAALKLAMDRGWGAGFDVDWLRNAGFKLGQLPARTDVDWPARLKAFYEEEVWAVGWGPRPGDPGCKAPPELIRTAA